MAHERLRALAASLPAARVIADIGCDHGLLCDMLLRERPQVKVIAADISRPSLDKARRLLGARHGSGRYELRLGDGLSVLQWGEADLIVAAGMGGHTLMRMLRAFPQVRGARLLVLCPHDHAEELRRFLMQSCLTLEDEQILEERGRFYPLLFVRPGGSREESDPFWDWTGHIRGQSGPVIRAYIRHLREKTTAAAEGARSHDPARSALFTARLARLDKEFP